jgi:hypothetical protein
MRAQFQHRGGEMQKPYRVIRELALMMALALVVFSPAALPVLAQAPAPQGPPGGLPDLVGMLKATPGVLGVDAARTVSGKQVIFAWFESKQAAVNWYYSAGHQQLVKTVAPGGVLGRKPLADVADDVGPIMVIASLTMGERGQGPGQMPFSQIAIELYAPLPGGLAAGGRFAPATVKVKGLVDVASPPKVTR